MTFQIELTEGSNLVSLPVLPDSMRVETIVADVLPHLTFVQDDAGRYFIPMQGIDGIGTWDWDEAYRIEAASPASLFVRGAAILPESSPLLIDGQVGNWIPYFRREPMAVEEAFAAIGSSLSRVEAADGRFYRPGDGASTLDSLRAGQGYKVWVSQPVTLTYPANPTPPETGPFALPGSPTPTATQEAIGMRSMFRDDPKGFNNHVSTAYDGATTQGERLWVGIGGVGYSYTHPAVAVEPDGAGGIVAEYVTEAGVLHDLPPLGTQIGTAGYPQKLYMSHEGTDMGAFIEYDDGSSAIHILLMDGLGSPHESFRFVEGADGSQRTEKVQIDGVNWSSQHKHHALDATVGGLVAMHAPRSHLHQEWPSLIYNRGVAASGDSDFTLPGTNYTGPFRLTLKVGAVGDTIYVVTNEDPALSALYEVGADSAFLDSRIIEQADFWGTQATTTSGFGPTPRYIGPAAGNPGLVIYTVTSRLDYHNGVSGSVIPVDEVSAYSYQRVRRGGVEETWRVTHPDLLVQRLAALSVGPTSATPTWVTEADLDLPAGWAPADVSHIEITENGSVWLIGRRPATFPASGVTTSDIAVAYYRGGNL